jgi:folate-dependent phosphoribosylglycinamide formyltransferase PurN
MDIGWFSTGKDKAARELLTFIQDKVLKKELNINIKFVFSNREYKESKESDLFFELVKSYNIPLILFSSSKYRQDLRKAKINLWRQEYDKQVYERIKSFLPVRLCMLAGYMLIVSQYLCNKILMINLHPSLPGKYKGSWQEVINQIIKNQDKEAGAMIHIVTPELDSGPCINYMKFEVKDYNFHKIREQELSLEFPLIYETLKLIAQGKINLDEKICRIL